MTGVQTCALPICQIISLAEAGLNVVTTAEELIHPYDKHPDTARRIDDAARASGACFVMGQAAGTAAAMVLNSPLDITALQSKLISEGAVLA